MIAIVSPPLDQEKAIGTETESPGDEDTEFKLLVGSNNITERIDSGIGLEELAEWCKDNNVPGDIAVNLMQRAVESGEAFIIY